MYLIRAYETLLRLYPERHRRLFGREMPTVFKEAAEERRSRGLPAFIAFLLRETAGLLVGGSLERLSALVYSSPSDPLRCTHPDEFAEAQERITFVLRRMEYAIAHHQFEKARFYSNEERKERKKLELAKNQNEPENDNGPSNRDTAIALKEPDE